MGDARNPAVNNFGMQIPLEPYLRSIAIKQKIVIETKTIVKVFMFPSTGIILQKQLTKK